MADPVDFEFRVNDDTKAVIEQLAKATATLDVYYEARRALEYLLEHVDELQCKCSGKIHESECPIGFAIEAQCRIEKRGG